MAESRHRPGTLVVVHDPRLAEQLGRVGEPGVVINGRRGDARVLFLPDRSTWWIEDRRLYPLPDPAAASPALRRLALALAELDPEEAELEGIADDGTLELSALATRFSMDTPERLRAGLGDALLSWEVVPYGMALVTVGLRIRGD